MRMKKKWQVGDTTYITKNEMSGLQWSKSLKVKITRIDAASAHPYQVCDDEGNTYYSKYEELNSLPSDFMKDEKVPVGVTATIKDPQNVGEKIRETRSQHARARTMGQIRKAADLQKKLNRQEKDLQRAIYNLIDAGWINE